LVSLPIILVLVKGPPKRLQRPFIDEGVRTRQSTPNFSDASLVYNILENTVWRRNRRTHPTNKYFKQFSDVFGTKVVTPGLVWCRRFHSHRKCTKVLLTAK